MRSARRSDRSWALLVSFCNDGGVLPFHEVGKAKGAAREAVSKLRARLRAAFPLEDDPVVAMRGGWKVAFAVTAEKREVREAREARERAARHRARVSDDDGW